MSQKNLHPRLLTAAAVLLFNPFISTLDLLPDAIAWMLILWAISGVAAFVPHFDTATQHAKKLLLITALKAPSYFVASAYVAGDSRLRVMFTLVCFVFTVLELIWLFPFFGEFFAGLTYLVERHGMTTLAEPGRRSSPLVRAQHAAYIALPAKLLLALLPEFTLLSTNESAGIIDAGRDLASFRPLLTAFAFLVALGFGIYFLIAFLPLCRSLRRDEQLEEQLREVRDVALPPLRGRERIRRIGYAAWCMAGGSFMMIDAVFDGINYLPDFLGVALLAAAAALLLPLCKKPAVYTLAAAGLAFVLSLISYMMRYRFFAVYSYEALGRIREADALYDRLSLFSVLESVAITLLYVALCALLFSLIKEETGYRADNAYNRASHEALHRSLCRKAVIMAVLGTLATVATTADVFLRRLTERYKITDSAGAAGSTILPLYGWFWLVVFALCLSHFLYTLHVAAVLRAEVAHKYSLD